MPGEIRPVTSSVLERFNSVLYPYPLEMLLERLPERGWVVPFEDTDDTSVKLKGPASKGSLKLAADQGARTLGVRGIEMAEVLAAFRDVRAFALDTFGLPPAASVWYAEVRYVGTVSVSHSLNKSLPELLDDWWHGHQRADQLGEVLSKWLPGGPLGAYGLRMATKRLDPNRPNWAELAISPLAVAGARYYRFDLLLRNEDIAAVEKVAEVANELVQAAAEELER